MLFDLRGRGRRTTVRIIYIGLAVLLGVGLIGFGIGGGFGGGGLLSAATNSEGGSTPTYQKQISKYRKLTAQNPRDASAWENLTRNLLHEAGGEGFVSSTGLTGKGHKIFGEVASAWTSYFALEPKKPNLELTKDMYRIYSEEGLNKPTEEVSLLQVLVGAEPSNPSYWALLAENSYKAHDKSLAELSGQKALALAPSSSRAHLKTTLEEIEKASESSSTSSGAATSSGATTSSTPEVVTTKTKGSGSTKKKK